jgi:FeS assembly SUF system regulator
MIRLTKQTDYGIVLMCRLALDRAGVHNAGDLAAETHLPVPMVSKILKLLARAGLLVSHRGVKGGYSLGPDAREVTVADIIEALEGPIAITECIDESPHECSYEATCGVRRNWQLINDAVRLALRGITLEEMAHPWRSGQVPSALRPPQDSRSGGSSELVSIRS